MKTIIAIDGPAGVGKSTTARAVAAALGIPYLDTGAMYRTVGWLTRDAGVDPDDGDEVVELLERHCITLEWDGERCSVLLDGRPVGDEIRSEEVGEVTSRVSTHPAVRARMVELQRDFAHRFGGVLEGRDIGTAVFPNTPFKFYLDANPAVRARRRHAQLEEGGRRVELPDLEREIIARDERDRSRSTAPLRLDPSHILIDTGDLSQDVVVGRILAAVRKTEASSDGT